MLELGTKNKWVRVCKTHRRSLRYSFKTEKPMVWFWELSNCWAGSHLEQIILMCHLPANKNMDYGLKVAGWINSMWSCAAGCICKPAHLAPASMDGLDVWTTRAVQSVSIQAPSSGGKGSSCSSSKDNRKWDCCFRWGPPRVPDGAVSWVWRGGL